MQHQPKPKQHQNQREHGQKLCVVDDPSRRQALESRCALAELQQRTRLPLQLLRTQAIELAWQLQLQVQLQRLQTNHFGFSHRGGQPALLLFQRGHCHCHRQTLRRHDAFRLQRQLHLHCERGAMLVQQRR